MRGEMQGAVLARAGGVHNTIPDPSLPSLAAGAGAKLPSPGGAGMSPPLLLPCALGGRGK